MRLSVLAINQLLASPTLRFDTLCSSILQVHYNMLMHTVHLLEHHHKSHLILTGQNSGGLQELGQKAIFLSFSLFCLEPNPLTKNVIPIQKKEGEVIFHTLSGFILYTTSGVHLKHLKQPLSPFHTKSSFAEESMNT